MPIYEFKCQSCEQITEKMQKISDPYPTDCPVCHNGKLQKIMSSTGFSLKGEGWYVTDFRSKSSPKTETAPSKDTSKKD